jgi:hypothetical protein
MAMPPQLKVGLLKRRPRSSPHPVVEELQSLNVNDLSKLVCKNPRTGKLEKSAFPKNPSDCNVLKGNHLSLRYPFLKHIRLTRFRVQMELWHGATQGFAVRWIRTGFGSWPRASLVCKCGRAVISLYLSYNHLACRRCAHATYASRTCNRRTRPYLQAARLKNYFDIVGHTRMHKHTRYRLQARRKAAEAKARRYPPIRSKRLKQPALLLPKSNYSALIAVHWR